MESQNTYQTLEEIRQRRITLQNELSDTEKTMRHIWNGLFHTGNTNAIPTPSKRFQTIITTGAGIIDGALLGWKLYRRFKK